MPIQKPNTNDQGWTQYQRLVLAELERHDERQTAFEKEMSEVRLAQARVILETSTCHSLIKELTIEVKNLVSAFNNQGLEINSLKTKIAIWCSVVSIIASSAVGVIIKFFLLG